MAEKAIHIEQLRYAYHDGRTALDGVSLDIAAGERVAVVGANGAGKSTLLLHLNGLLAGKGTVVIMGQRVRHESLTEVRRAVGLLFQDPDDQLFSPQVIDDVAFGPLNLGLTGEALAKRISEALAAVDLEGYEKRSPHHLSYGEKKRVALATVLAMRPRILALDEPTANLDPRSRRHLIDILKGIDCTLVIATHDLEAVLELCPRTVVLLKGKVVADGETARLLSDSELMDATGLEKPLALR